MEVRAVTPDDLEALHGLFEGFLAEVPLPDYSGDDEESRRQFLAAYAQEHVALVAWNGDAPAGFVLARLKRPRLGSVDDMYVEPAARRSGVAATLLGNATQELRRRGAEVIALEVSSDNAEARAVYERWGFRETRLRLEMGAGDLEERLSREEPEPSYGVVYVQSDDTSRIDQAVRSYVPRLGRSARTDVRPPANGWIAIEDELCSGDPELLRRLAQELSYRTGGVVLALGIEEGAVVRYVLFDRGAVADEYASLPEYHGLLPPGDVVGLSANPTVAHRLTGADPERVRAAARTAASPAELPPPEELFAELAAVLGVPQV